jgi:bifunctional pyridoxal-dependent enzyme with beta-cystathionase and maltose regulon repressor activities
MWLDANKLSDRIDATRLAAEANAKPPALDPFTKKPIRVTRADMASEWLAKHAEVFLESGSGFGKGGENYLRLNVATSRVTLKAALDSMAGALGKLA